MKHLLSIEHLAQADMEAILADTVKLKQERGRHAKQPLSGQCWAMIFTKSSTRTRVSFEVGIRELGGDVHLPRSGRHPARPRRTDQGHRARPRPHGARRGDPHLRPEGCRGLRALRRDSDDQCPHRRGAPVPDPRGSLHHPGKARPIEGRSSPSSATATAMSRAPGSGPPQSRI